MKKIYFLLFCFHFLLLGAGMAQKGKIKGNIADSQSKETLIGVLISVNDSAGALSDIDGNYELKLRPGSHTLGYKLMGYEAWSEKIIIKENEVLIKNISLKTEAKQLATMVVSASKFEQKISDVTVSMEVIKPYLAEHTNTTNMETVIDQTPGVTITDGNASIRGGSGFSYGAGSRVLVMVDDLPMLTADAGDVKWSFLPVENLEQIEVIKGASSALFGSSALNGVINIRTAYPRDKPETKINIFHGFYDDPQRAMMKWWTRPNPGYTGTSFSHSRKIGQLDLVLGGNAFTDEGYRMGEKEERIRFNFNTRYRFKNIEGLSAGLNGNIMHSKGGNFLIWQNDSSGALKPQLGTLSSYISLRANIDPYITYITKNSAVHKIRTRYFFTSNNNNTQQKSDAELFYGDYQFQKEIKSWKTNFSAGINSIYSVVKSELYKNHTSQNTALYAQLDKKFGERISVSLGIRGEYFKIDSIENKTNIPVPFTNKSENTILVHGSPLRPVVRAGVNYQLHKSTYLRSSFGQGYRYPTIAERYIKTNVGSIYVYPNDTLKAESGWSGEIGLKQGLQFGSWSGYVDAAYFWTEYQDMMEFTFGKYGKMTDPLNGLGFKSVNIGNAVIKGVDLSLTGGGKIGAFNLMMLAGYTFMDPKQLDFDAKKDTIKNSAKYNILKYRYKHIAKFDIEGTYKKFSLGFSFRYNSFMENIDEVFNKVISGVEHYRKLHNNGDYIIDNRISWQFNDQFRLAIVTKNLLNREYMGRPADLQAPRSIAMQLSIHF